MFDAIALILFLLLFRDKIAKKSACESKEKNPNKFYHLAFMFCSSIVALVVLCLIDSLIATKFSTSMMWNIIVWCICFLLFSIQAILLLKMLGFENVEMWFFAYLIFQGCIWVIKYTFGVQ